MYALSTFSVIYCTLCKRGRYHANIIITAYLAMLSLPQASRDRETSFIQTCPVLNRSKAAEPEQSRLLLSSPPLVAGPGLIVRCPAKGIWVSLFPLSLCQRLRGPGWVLVLVYAQHLCFSVPRFLSQSWKRGTQLPGKRAALERITCANVLAAVKRFAGCKMGYRFGMGPTGRSKL